MFRPSLLAGLPSSSSGLLFFYGPLYAFQPLPPLLSLLIHARIKIHCALLMFFIYAARESAWISALRSPPPGPPPRLLTPIAPLSGRLSLSDVHFEAIAHPSTPAYCASRACLRDRTAVNGARIAAIHCATAGRSRALQLRSRANCARSDFYRIIGVPAPRAISTLNYKWQGRKLNKRQLKESGGRSSRVYFRDATAAHPR